MQQAKAKSYSVLEVVYGDSIVQFSVEPFSARASAWQLLQNMTVYGLLATLTYVPSRHRAAEAALADAPETRQPNPVPTHFFVRSGDDIRPIEVAAIISIVVSAIKVIDFIARNRKASVRQLEGAVSSIAASPTRLR